MKTLIKKQQTERIKREQTMKYRNRKAHEELDQSKLFILGLRDECPKCGEELEYYSGEDARDHLRNCNDEKKIKE
jgi:hypothetical protein